MLNFIIPEIKMRNTTNKLKKTALIPIHNTLEIYQFNLEPHLSIQKASFDLKFPRSIISKRKQVVKIVV